MPQAHIAILGAGLTGCSAALEAARLGMKVHLFDKEPLPMNRASLHNEGKLHLGYVYGADPKSETHQVMIKGSLSFISLIKSLSDTKDIDLIKSKPFLYAIPNDSQLSVNQQLDHFKHVDSKIEELYKSNDLYQGSACPTASKQQNQKACFSTFNAASIQAAIQTDEYSVNTTQVANIISAAVMAHPNIDLKLNVNIESAFLNQDGTYHVQLQDTPQNEKYDGVINCLWEDRIRIDRSNNIQPERPWLVRYKAAISGYAPLSSASQIPSATFITGAYGDIVNHSDGHFYLSWYPKCKLGESQSDNYPEIEKNIALLNKKRLVKDSIHAMADFIPSLSSALNKATNIKVAGGYIFAWGKSDIIDPNSQLHQRHMIGPIEHDRWISVDTGKYCTAPMFGSQAALLLFKQLT